ncbi:hypothetical protein [Catelliglobosispora koreensis]|uniref:hypothetical protein n=1 Tax=Catelliglobosispora koreensis TaxID=129052 RepID=UPI00036092A3|nr:hypothetical protein [Catelliglobosispora koreensis]
MPTEALVRVQRFLDSRLVYRLVVVGVVFALGWSLILSYQQRRLTGEQRRLTECVAAYVDAANANQRLRAEIASDERELSTALLAEQNRALHIADPAARLAALQRAFGEYEKGRAFNEGKREGNPIPPPPSQTCG